MYFLYCCQMPMSAYYTLSYQHYFLSSLLYLQTFNDNDKCKALVIQILKTLITYLYCLCSMYYRKYICHYIHLLNKRFLELGSLSYLDVRTLSFIITSMKQCHYNFKSMSVHHCRNVILMVVVCS